MIFLRASGPRDTCLLGWGPRNSSENGAGHSGRTHRHLQSEELPGRRPVSRCGQSRCGRAPLSRGAAGRDAVSALPLRLWKDKGSHTGNPWERSLLREDSGGDPDSCVRRICLRGAGVRRQGAGALCPRVQGLPACAVSVPCWSGRRVIGPCRAWRVLTATGVPATLDRGGSLGAEWEGSSLHQGWHSLTRETPDTKVTLKGTPGQAVAAQGERWTWSFS